MCSSRKQALEKGATRYFTGKECARGHVAERHTTNSTCVECSADRVVQWRIDNPDRYKESARRQQSTPSAKAKHAAWLKKDRDANPDKYTAWMSEWYFANKEHARELNRDWASRNRAALNARLSERHLAKSKATPTWLTDTHRALIREVYETAQRLSVETGIKHHVDHIVPIKGATVCGLHVPWNLRAIPYDENVRKKNKLIQELAIAA